MIENLQDKLYQMEKRQVKGAKLVLTSDENWRAKNAQKRFSKYLKDIVCKIKQYLDYIVLIINQNILDVLRTFPNLQKYFKNLTPSRQLPKLLLLTKFLSKIPI